jgi:hypothetical protein
MKIKKFNESSNDQPYYKELGFDMDVTDYLAASYQLWTEAEGLPPLSADEYNREKLTPEQIKYLDAFIELWDITEDFENIYSKDNFVPKSITNKYNL